MKVRGQEILRWPYASLEDFKARPAMSGIPFVGPWANRLDEQAFYANGKKYVFDMALGNVRGAIPIHIGVFVSHKYSAKSLPRQATESVIQVPRTELSSSTRGFCEFRESHI